MRSSTKNSKILKILSSKEIKFICAGALTKVARASWLDTAEVK